MDIFLSLWMSRTGGFDCRTDALLEIAVVTIGMDEQGFVFPESRESAHVIPFEGSNIEQSAIDFIGIDPFSTPCV